MLKSRGDHWNGDGYIWLKYSDVATNLWDWRYIDTKASDRTGTKYAYSARLCISGDGGALRNQLMLRDHSAPLSFHQRFPGSPGRDRPQASFYGLSSPATTAWLFVPVPAGCSMND